MKLIKKGAEGDLYHTRWDTRDAILKVRHPKEYRNPKLDAQIRHQRTIREAEIIQHVKSLGIAAPVIFFVNTAKSVIVMQRMSGKPVYCTKKKKFVDLMYKIGKIVGTLHKNGIMHGDLTTSNFIVHYDRVFIIDFGLSVRTSKPEDHAVDLRLFKEILNSAHVDEMSAAWPKFLSGYKSVMGKKFDAVLHLVSVIEGRGRYATVV